MSKTGIALLAVLGTLLAMILAVEIWKSANPQPGPSRESGNPTADFRLPTAVTWREVARQPLSSDSDDFQNSMMYQDDGHAPEPSRRWIIEGRWAASAPVLFVVMDDANYERLQKGFIPLLIFSQAKPPVRFASPAQSFWYGFVALPPAQPATEQAKIPASIPELLLFVFRESQRSQTPPIRLSCDFWLVTENSS
jgi:hypothetical protein